MHVWGKIPHKLTKKEREISLTTHKSDENGFLSNWKLWLKIHKSAIKFNKIWLHRLTKFYEESSNGNFINSQIWEKMLQDHNTNGAYWRFNACTQGPDEITLLGAGPLYQVKLFFSLFSISQILLIFFLMILFLFKNETDFIY